MKAILILGLLFFANYAKSAQEELALPEFQLISSEADPSLEKGQSRITFTVHSDEGIAENAEIKWSIDSENRQAKLNKSNQFIALISSGEHKFQFYLNYKHAEIYTQSVNFVGGMHYHYKLNFSYAPVRIQCEKPVIYLYPETEQEVEVKLIPKGELFFTYPQIADNTWTVTANSDGSLQHGDESLRYLFWESLNKAPEVDWSGSFVITKDDVTQFLSEKLKQIGLTSEERADMITYWGPRMMQHSACMVQFRFNESCNDFAELDISPKPDNINRVYILFKGVENIADVLVFKPPFIQKLDRTGFDVLEWGGMEFISEANPGI